MSWDPRRFSPFAFLFRRENCPSQILLICSTLNGFDGNQVKREGGKEYLPEVGENPKGCVQLFAFPLGDQGEGKATSFSFSSVFHLFKNKSWFPSLLLRSYAYTTPTSSFSSNFQLERTSGREGRREEGREKSRTSSRDFGRLCRDEDERKYRRNQQADHPYTPLLSPYTSKRPPQPYRTHDKTNPLQPTLLLPSSTSHAFLLPSLSKPQKTEPNIHPLFPFFSLFSSRWDDLLNTRSSGESSPPRLIPRPRFVLHPFPWTSHVLSVSAGQPQADHHLSLFSLPPLLHHHLHLPSITFASMLPWNEHHHSSSE